MKKNALLTLVLLVMVVANLYIVELILSYRDKNIYPSNLFLAGVSLAGTSREEALKSWPGEAKTVWGDTITLKWPGGVFNIPLERWGIEYDAAASLDRADSLLKGEKTAYMHHIVMRGKKQEVTPVFKWDEKRLQLEVVALVMKETSPKKEADARLYCDNTGKLQFKAEEYGYKIDPLGTYRKVADHLKAGTLNIEAEVIPVKPEITLEKIDKINTLLNVEAFKTEAIYPSWHDLLAAVDGKAVLPDKKWDLEKSLAEIPVYSYVLKSDKDLLLSALVKAWQGAGLKTDGYKLINEGKGPVGITLNVEKNDILVVRVWGLEDNKKKVVIKKEEKIIEMPVEIKIDQNLPPGEKRVENGEEGRIVFNYKVVLVDGREKEKKLLWQETEPPKANIVYYGRGTAAGK